jgi:hypothetical protein
VSFGKLKKQFVGLVTLPAPAQLHNCEEVFLPKSQAVQHSLYAIRLCYVYEAEVVYLTQIQSVPIGALEALGDLRSQGAFAESPTWSYAIGHNGKTDFALSSKTMTYETLVKLAKKARRI